MDPPAAVVDYDLAWPAAFAVVRDHLQTVLPAAARIEHVGSTAVPGLPAKPILDVDVVVAAAADVLPTVATLATLGYEHRGDLGISGREAFTVPPDLPYHHLYVVVDHSQPYRDHVDLRDHLRTHPADARRYAAEKYRLAHLLATDRDAYVHGKAWLVEELLAVARRTATPDARD